MVVLAVTAGADRLLGVPECTAFGRIIRRLA
jgi:hypothetical protein